MLQCEILFTFVSWSFSMSTSAYYSISIVQRSDYCLSWNELHCTLFILNLPLIFAVISLTNCIAQLFSFQGSPPLGLCTRKAQCGFGGGWQHGNPGTGWPIRKQGVLLYKLLRVMYKMSSACNIECGNDLLYSGEAYVVPSSGVAFSMPVMGGGFHWCTFLLLLLCPNTQHFCGFRRIWTAMYLAKEGED